MKNALVDAWMEQYPYQLRALTPEQGGGWVAFATGLSELVYFADAETPEDALSLLREVQRIQFEALAAAGEAPPPPPVASSIAETKSAQTYDSLDELFAVLLAARPSHLRDVDEIPLAA